MRIFNKAIKLFYNYSACVAPKMPAARFISSKNVPKFADPTYDMTFKMLFGTEQNKDLTKKLMI